MAALLADFRFESPWLLLALPLALLTGWWMARRRRRGDARLRLPGAISRMGLGGGPWVRLQQSLPVIRILARIWHCALNLRIFILFTRSI